MRTVDEAVEKARWALRHMPTDLEFSGALNFAEEEAQLRLLWLYNNDCRPSRQLDETRLNEQISLADAGVAEADALLRVAAAELLEQCRPLPEELAMFTARALRISIRHRRKHRFQNRIRDLHIAMCVCSVAELGFHPTRNPASRGSEDAVMSACAITAKALGDFGIHLTEEAVEKVWQKMAHIR